MSFTETPPISGVSSIVFEPSCGKTMVGAEIAVEGGVTAPLSGAEIFILMYSEKSLPSPVTW